MNLSAMKRVKRRISLRRRGEPVGIVPLRRGAVKAFEAQPGAGRRQPILRGDERAPARRKVLDIPRRQCDNSRGLMP